jgi:hypothetical protein
VYIKEGDNPPFADFMIFDCIPKAIYSSKHLEENIIPESKKILPFSEFLRYNCRLRYSIEFFDRKESVCPKGLINLVSITGCAFTDSANACPLLMDAKS